MKRILTTLCALAFVMAGSIPALAAEADADTGQSASYYPISVEEYTYGSLDEPRVEKVYQLSLSDDPSGIPTEDFVRNGRLYYLLDMTRKNEVGVDTKPHIETISQASDTNDMETILQQLNAELEVTTEDGYTGILHLDHTTVKVTADGYATKTQALSASRSYPNLSEADVSLIPKSIEERGNTLTLADVQWDSSEQTDGAGGIVTRYTATASYTGSSSYQYATGYTVTADYSGEVAKPDCDVVTYIRGAILTDHARASGFAVIVYNQDTGGVPMISGQSAVYGRVSGDVRLTDTALVISGEEIQNDTLDTLAISGQGRSVIRGASRDELAPLAGQLESTKAKIKERQVER